MAAKGREVIHLKSEVSGFFYTTFKSKAKTPGKLKMKKYDPTVRKHVWFEESKI